MTLHALMPQPCPNPAGAWSPATLPPCPSPYRGHGQGQGMGSPEKSSTVPLLTGPDFGGSR